MFLRTSVPLRPSRGARAIHPNSIAAEGGGGLLAVAGPTRQAAPSACEQGAKRRRRRPRGCSLAWGLTRGQRGRTPRPKKWPRDPPTASGVATRPTPAAQAKPSIPGSHRHLGWQPPCGRRRGRLARHRDYMPQSGARQPLAKRARRVAPVAGRERTKTRSHESTWWSAT